MFPDTRERFGILAGNDLTEVEKTNIILSTDMKLDGHVARITGLGNRVATVWAETKDHYLEVEYCWDTVRRIMSTTKEFFTK